MAEIAILGASERLLQRLAAAGQERFPSRQFIVRPVGVSVERQKMTASGENDDDIVYLSSGETPGAELLSPGQPQHWLLTYSQVWAWNPHSAEHRQLVSPWLGHPKLTLVGNGPEDWSQVSNDDYQLLEQQLLGLFDNTPEIEQEYKFLISGPEQQLAALPQQLAQRGPLAKVNISQSYLSPPGAGVERRVRHWSCSGADFYLYAEKRRGQQGDPSQRQEEETFISEQDYREMLPTSAPTVVKQRYIFLFQGQKWEMDRINQRWFMELETAGPKPRQLPYPELLTQVQEVTGQRQWSNRSQAR